jgi:hypothetical protein
MIGEKTKRKRQPQAMRECSSVLEREMMSWPAIKVSHIFGTLAFYPRKVMVASLPDKRSLESSTAISFCAPLEGGATQDTDWRTFELTNRDFVGHALSLLDRAYKESALRPFSIRPDPSPVFKALPVGSGPPSQL